MKKSDTSKVSLGADEEDDALYTLINEQNWDILYEKLRKNDFGTGGTINRSSIYHSSNILSHAVNCDSPHHIIQKLIQITDGKKLVSMPSVEGKLPIHQIRRNTSLETVKLLVEIGGKQTLREPDDNGMLAIHCGLEYGVDLKIIKFIVETGACDMIFVGANDGRNAIHCACGNDNVSVDTIKYLVEVAGDDALLGRSINGDLPIHCLCRGDKSLDVIKYFYEYAGIETCLATNGNGLTPLDLLLEKGQTDAIEHTQQIWLQVDPNMKKVSELTSIAIFKWISSFPKEDRDKVASESELFVKLLLNNRFMQSKYLGITMLDLYIRMVTTIVYSFVIDTGYIDILGGIDDGLRHQTMIMAILALSLLWMVFRELVEMSTFTLQTFLMDATKVGVDLSQVIFTAISLREFYLTSGNHQGLFIATMGTSWFGLLYGGLCNISHHLSIIVVTCVEILKGLISFLVGIALIVIMFAHMFRISYMEEECDETSGWTESVNGWKSCRYIDSYLKTLNLFLGNDEYFEDKSGFLSLMFMLSSIVGILILCAIIVVMNHSYLRAAENAEHVYWHKKCKWIVDVSKMLSLLCGMHNLKTKQSCTLGQLSDHILEERISFSSYPESKCWTSLPDNFGYWWFEAQAHFRPSLIKRMIILYRFACVQEIFFPSNIFLLVFLGLPYNADLSKKSYSYKQDCKSIKKIEVPISTVIVIGARIINWILFSLHIVSSITLFLLGLVSFGWFWPVPMKKLLFNTKTPMEKSVAMDVDFVVDQIEDMKTKQELEFEMILLLSKQMQDQTASLQELKTTLERRDTEWSDF